MCASPVHKKKCTPKIPAQQFENRTDGDDGNLEMYAKKAKKNVAKSIVSKVFYGSGRVAKNSIVIRVYPLGISVVNEVIFFYKNHYKIPLRGNKRPFIRKTKDYSVLILLSSTVRTTAQRYHIKNEALY